MSSVIICSCLSIKVQLKGHLSCEASSGIHRLNQHLLPLHTDDFPYLHVQQFLVLCISDAYLQARLPTTLGTFTGRIRLFSSAPKLLARAWQRAGVQ